MGKIKKKRKMTTRRAKRDENTRARKLFLILTGLLIWISAISGIGGLYLIFTGQEFDIFVVIIQLVILISLVLGLWAILYVKPPFHYFVFIGAGINLVVSGILVFIGNSTGLIQGLISLLIIYLGLRFPIKFEMGEATFTES